MKNLVFLVIVCAALATDYIAHFKEQVNFDTLRHPITGVPVAEMGWEEKGKLVYHELKRAADISQRQVREYLTALGIKHTAYFVINAIYVELTNKQTTTKVVEFLKSRDEIASVSLAPIVNILEDTVEDTNAEPADVEWSMDLIKAPAAWEKGFKGKNIVVANLDSGVFLHEDLVKNYRGNVGNGKLENDYNWYDVTSRKCAEPCDPLGHGTHTMGTICGSGPKKNYGAAYEAKWIACKVTGSSVVKEWLDCFNWFLAPTKRDGKDPDTTKRPHVVSHSWRFRNRVKEFKNAVENLHAAGVLQVFAAGNEGSRCSTLGHPSCEVAPLTVGATAFKSTKIASFSSRGPPPKDVGKHIKPDVVAPGQTVTSCKNAKTGYVSMSGTSMATPAVTGSVALLLSAKPELIGKVEEIKKAMQQNAMPLESKECSSPQKTPNMVFGYGMVDNSKF